jgi:hypothetical protein
LHSAACFVGASVILNSRPGSRRTNETAEIGVFVRTLSYREAARGANAHTQNGQASVCVGNH